ncbi:MAG: DUF3843 family protein [Bacteroidota bacterium]
MKKKILSPKISIQDWLKFKPYKVPSSYDTFYLERCREIYDLLGKYDDWLEDIELAEDEKKNLACILVSYYEDFISEIGIWKGFIDTNQELYGTYLPFYNLTDYDPDYLNRQDFAYLVWHFLTKYNEDSTQAPDSGWIMDLAEKLYEALEPGIDDSPATEMYDKLFSVPDKQDFFGCKEPLQWFAIQSYLIGMDFGRQLRELTYEAQYSGKFAPEHIGPVLYAISEPFVFTKRSSYSALNAPEWFSRVARCSAQKREEIKNLCYWHPGKYRLEETHDKTYIRFTHLYTNQTYLVRRDSFQNSKKPGTDGMMFQMTLIQWNGDWWLSGIMYSLYDTEKEMKQYQRSITNTPWILPDNLIQTSIKATEEMYQSFVNFFGSPLAQFKNKAEINEKTQAFMEYQALTKEPDPQKLATLQQKFRESAGIKNSAVDYTQEFKGRPDKDFATFFAEGLGIITFQGVGDIIQLMEKHALSPKEKVDLFVSLTNGFQPVFARWLLANYPTQNIGIPVKSDVDGLQNMEFFWRFYHPEEFDKIYPMTIVVT